MIRASLRDGYELLGDDSLAASSSLTPAQINEVLNSCGLESDSALVGRVATYLKFLAKWNARMNLTAIQAPLDVLRNLLAESFFAAVLVGDLEGPILDIGSGAGFPGLAMAVYRPELKLILLEPRKKRSAFLAALRRELGLTRVAVWNRRLEDCATADFAELPTLLTMRAVGRVKEMVEQGIPLLEGSRRILLFSSLRAAKASIEGMKGICWRRPSLVPWNPEHVLLLGEVQEMFPVRH
ncbi:MAG: 16S rRNA (guanine(527)-N(7))-methyltransferase RsmG [Terriglobia bacterium]